MSRELNRYANKLQNKIKKTSINHKHRSHLHKMSKGDIEGHYSKYFSEQGNIEHSLQLNKEFEQIENNDYEMYEKWLMESD